jgi:hypothetical protein
MKTALQIYKEVDEEFCKGSPGSLVNRKCHTSEDVIIWAMHEYHKQRLDSYKQEREIREEFKDDLDALLKKYNATMFMGDEGQVEVCIAAKFDAEGVCTQEYIEIELGEYFEKYIK